LVHLRVRERRRHRAVLGRLDRRDHRDRARPPGAGRAPDGDTHARTLRGRARDPRRAVHDLSRAVPRAEGLVTSEKPTTELLFSYGTLQLEAVQLSTFGRT